MYNNSYGYGVYKRNQVNIGNPYQMQKAVPRYSFEEEEEEEINGTAANIKESDKDLVISQDIVYKAKEDAAVMKREAELEAERMLSEAQEQAEALLAETEQKAKEEGYRHGETLAQQHYSELLAEAQEFRDRCKSEYEDTLNSLEQDIVELVVKIAAKVVGDEITKNEQAILGVVRETIHACSNRDHVLLKVSAEDYPVVLQNEETLRSMVSDVNELEIKKDGALARGSCIVETGYGSVDGSCDTLVDNIRQAFFSLMQNSETNLD